MAGPLTIAVPKGRTLGALVTILGRAGIDATIVTDDKSRALVREAAGYRFLLVKPDDVATYVERGIAEVGVCGRDVLREHEPDVAMPIDLGIARCKLMVCGTVGRAIPDDLPRIATKYPRSAAAHFAKRGTQIDLVHLHGSVELAAVTGLADAIVDLVETGETLAKNGLEPKELVYEVSAIVVVNRAAAKLRRAEVDGLTDRLRAAI
ncbi:ATP phosphoribosyltransferase [soil metagenome]